MNGRIGTVMLTLLIVMMVGGLIAARLIPSYEVQQQRQSDLQLKFSLAQIRQAFDLKRQASPSYNPSLDTPAAILQVLRDLTRENYLRSESLQDMTVPQYSWGVSVNQSYWKGTGNIASNTSFEDDDTSTGFLASWTVGTSDTRAASDTTFFPSKDTAVFDDYNGQNKLGKILSNTGNSIMISK